MAARASRAARSVRSPSHRAAQMPAFVAPQLAKLVDRPPEGEGWGHEIKLDGSPYSGRVTRYEA